MASSGPASLRPADCVEGAQPPSKRAPLSRSALSWTLYHAGRDPYVILIGKTVFIPYFATIVVGNAVKGQALVAMYTLVASLFVAFTAPFLGAVIDIKKGRRRWLGVLTALTVPAIASLWFVRPGIGPHGIAMTAVLLGTILILISYADLVHNSMIVDSVYPQERTRASGLALSFGNGSASILLIGMLVAFVMPGKLESGLIPAQPLFGLDPALFEPNRVVALIVAGALAIFTIPLLVFGRDEPPTKVRIGPTLVQSVRNVGALITNASLPGNVVLFLVGRMLLQNGKMAILIFGGIYAAGVMGWGALDLMLLGLLITPVGVLGGATGTWLDDRLGPKYAFALENCMSILALVTMVSVTPSTIFYGLEVGDRPVWGSPVFSSLPDLVYVAAAIVSQTFGTAAFASGRTFMARLTPPDKAGTYFGLFALSGSATMWVLPLLVERFTNAYNSQQAGFAPIIVMMAIGLTLLLFVKGGAREV